tara:strand:+ start:9331 stop:10053 length:723 start_codon:yes stop_codon:yes gene_type:complete
MNYKDYLDIAKKTAIKAGDFLIKNKLNKKVVLAEEGRDIKLELDRETENLIRKELEKTNIIILGEEFGGEISSKSLRWVIDPIDGTANYFRGLDQCCVSIALMDQDKSKLGIVYNFNNGEIYSAAEGYGCYLNDSKINVSDIDQKNKASITTGFPASETIDSQYEFLDELQGWKKIRMFGSAALSCAYIASGKCDYYAEKGVYLWDFAAGICLVEEAGGNAEYSLIDEERYAVRFSNGKL